MALRSGPWRGSICPSHRVSKTHVLGPQLGISLLFTACLPGSRPAFLGKEGGGGSRTPTQRRVDRSRSTTWYRLPKARRSWPSTALTPEQNQLGLEGSRHVMRGAGCGAEGQKCARPEWSCSASGDALSTAGRMLQGVQHFHGFLHFLEFRSSFHSSCLRDA